MVVLRGGLSKEWVISTRIGIPDFFMTSDSVAGSPFKFHLRLKKHLRSWLIL